MTKKVKQVAWDDKARVDMDGNIWHEAPEEGKMVPYIRPTSVDIWYIARNLCMALGPAMDSQYHTGLFVGVIHRSLGECEAMRRRNGTQEPK